MINRKTFFEGYKKTFGNLNQKQVNGISFLLDKLDESDFTLATEYAWILAMLRHETANTFQPVLEGYWLSNNRETRIKKLITYYRNNFPHNVKSLFPNGFNYPTYEGRGYAQLTHQYNYVKFQKVILEKFGIDIVKDPDKVENPELSWFILVKGITDKRLSFSGVVLSQYINENKTDYYNARRTVNGTFRAKAIALEAEKFYKFLDFE